MADEQLRLVASVKDEFSAPLRNLKGQLAGVKPPPGMKEMSVGLKQWQADLRAVRTELQTGLAPALSGFGISSLGFGAALAGVTMGVRNFSAGVQGMRLMGQEVGLTTNRLRAFSELGQRFGVSAESMQSGIKSFAGTMEDVRKRWGEAYGALRAMNLGSLAEDLVKAPDMNSAIERVFGELGNISDPEKRRRVLRVLGLPDDWSIIAVELKGKVKQTVDEIEKNQGQIGASTEKAATQFEENMSKMRQSLENLRVQGFTPLLPIAAEFVETMAKGASSPQFIKSLNDVLATTREEFEGIKKAWDWLANKGEVTPLTNDDEIKKRESELRKVQRQANSNEEAGLDKQYPEAQRDLKREIERLTGEIKKLREEGGGATAQKSAFGGGGGFGGMIQNASFGGAGAVPFRFGFGGGFNPGGGPAPGGGDRGTGAGAGAARGSGSSGGAGAGRWNDARAAEGAGRYRPEYKLSDADLDQRVVNTIAGEVSTRNPEGVDAVINNMLNRVGTKGWGPSRNLLEVARAPKQYAGYRKANETESEFVRSRIRALASGGVPDNTGGSNSYRAESYYRGEGANRTWARTSDIGPNVGGNRYAFAPGARNGPYAPYATPRDVETAGAGTRAGDSMMGRAFGPGGVAAGAPKLDAKGSVHVTLGPGLEKLPARVTMDGLFNDVQVSRASQVSSI